MISHRIAEGGGKYSSCFEIMSFSNWTLDNKDMPYGCLQPFPEEEQLHIGNYGVLIVQS